MAEYRITVERRSRHRSMVEATSKMAALDNPIAEAVSQGLDFDEDRILWSRAKIVRAQPKPRKTKHKISVSNRADGYSVACSCGWKIACSYPTWVAAGRAGQDHRKSNHCRIQHKGEATYDEESAAERWQAQCICGWSGPRTCYMTDAVAASRSHVRGSRE